MAHKNTRASKLVPALCFAAIAAAFAGNALAAAPDHVRVIVAFKPGAAANIKSAVAKLGGTHKLDIFGTNAMAVEVPNPAIKGLENNPNVEYVEEDVVRKPFALTTPSTGTPYQLGQQVPYGIQLVQADQLPDTNTANRKICIIDSGVDFTHEDLKDNGTNVTGEYDSGTGWWNTDETHHGTHVFGTIAGVNNGLGVVGVNPNKHLKIHVVKVFGADGAWTYSSTLAAAANKCSAAGANIITMSLGGTGGSITEQNTFNTLQKNGILSIAAAGNAGNSTVSYPAGYSAVMSVAAVDQNKVVASFSQFNSDVEIAGPGVSVLSSVPTGTGTDTSTTVGGTAYAPTPMTGSPNGTATAPLADFGIGDVVNTAVSGKVCLIQRGTVDFATKVSNCQSSGGVGAIVYNNVAGAFGGTLGTTVTSIPSVTVSDTDGASMKTKLGQSATVAITASNYAYFDGTSMATPHVSAVAALVWSYFPTCTGSQIRTSLNNSALDLGTAGRDSYYGYGLVQAKAAYDRIKSLGCGK